MFETRPAQEVLSDLGSGVTGLSESEAARRLASDGENALKEKEPPTRLQLFLAQLKDPMIYVLLAAAVISVALGEFSDAVIILGVVLLNAVVGMVQEGKADAIITAINTAQLYLEDNPNCGMSLVPDFRFVEDESTKGTRIGVAKGETELMAEVNRIIAEVREEGLYDQWYEEYTDYARSLGIQ